MLSLKIVPHAEGKRREILTNKKVENNQNKMRQINKETKKEKNKEGGK